MMSQQPTQAIAAGKEHRLFFVRGRMRSGTNWVGSLLNLHPQIHCRGEYHFHRLVSGIKEFRELPFYDRKAEPVRAVIDAGVREIVRNCLVAGAPLKPTAIWLGDRTPEVLTDAYGDYPTIYIVRDGRDALVSWWFHSLTHRKAPNDPAFDQFQAEYKKAPETLVDNPERLFGLKQYTLNGIIQWRDHVRADLDWIARSRAAGRSGELLFVSYERLHADVDGWRRRMYEFLGADPALAEPVSIESKTAAGFGRPEKPDAFHRSGEVGNWKKYFTTEVKQVFKELAGETLVELGYEKNQDW